MFVCLVKSLVPRSSSSRVALRSFRSGGFEDSLGGTVTIFRTTTPAKDSANASKFDKSPNVELRLRQQFTAPPGGTDPRMDSTGRIVWPTAMALLERIHHDVCRQRKGDTPLNILELGSGCGLLGLGLASTGLANVVLTDHNDAMEWLEHNVELNRDVVGGHAKTATLNWGKEEDFLNISAFHPCAFDLIVGSDIIYNHSVHTELVETVARFASPGSIIFIGYPKRKDEVQFLSVAQELFHAEVKSLTTAAAVTESSLAILTRKNEVCE